MKFERFRTNDNSILTRSVGKCEDGKVFKSLSFRSFGVLVYGDYDNVEAFIKWFKHHEYMEGLDMGNCIALTSDGDAFFGNALYPIKSVFDDQTRFSFLPGKVTLEFVNPK